MKIAVTKNVEIEDEIVDKIVIEALKSDYDTFQDIAKGYNKIDWKARIDDYVNSENIEACAVMLRYRLTEEDFNEFMGKYQQTSDVSDIGYGLGKDANGNFNSDLILSALRNGVLNVAFYKKDGSRRYMDCTLMDSYIDDYNVKGDGSRVRDPDLIRVWDVDNDGWRSFKVSRLFSVERADDELDDTF